MKTQKLILSTLFVLLAMIIIKPANAQRCAVLEFKAGSGISQADVDGISAIFITYFQPAGYTMVERTQINKVIDEQGFQRSNLTQSQMVRIGQILNVSKIVVGDINYVFGQYQVDVRAINVETGTIAATEGSTFATSSYRSSMQSVAQKLAGKIALTPGPTVQSSTSNTSAQIPTSEPYVIYGYLKIFPNDLGTFEFEPYKVIAKLNQSKQYGYGTWRLPTNEELQLMRANNLIGSGNYMTKENKKGIVRLVTDKEKGEMLPDVNQGYVDLGLPSGTLWKDNNEISGFYTYDQAVARFGNSLPTIEQFNELRNACQWTWIGNGFKVTGPNGESIVLPAGGGNGEYTGIRDVGTVGQYWSNESYNSYCAWYLFFTSSGSSTSYVNREDGKSVRLVRN